MARFTISCGLKIEAWHRYLTDHPDKRLIEYLTYGFPLSITDFDSYVIIAYQTIILLFNSQLQLITISKKNLILGPCSAIFDQADAPFYHCSPLLTRLKGNNDMHVILNLSYPAGTSLNDAVTKHLFDGQHFTLKFQLWITYWMALR